MTTAPEAQWLLTIKVYFLIMSLAQWGVAVGGALLCECLVPRLLLPVSLLSCVWRISFCAMASFGGLAKPVGPSQNNDFLKIN